MEAIKFVLRNGHGVWYRVGTAACTLKPGGGRGEAKIFCVGGVETRRMSQVVCVVIPSITRLKKKKKKKKGGENGNKLDVNEIAFCLLLGFLVEPSRVYGPMLLVYMAFVFGWCSYTVLFVELLLTAPYIKHTHIYIYILDGG